MLRSLCLLLCISLAVSSITWGGPAPGIVIEQLSSSTCSQYNATIFQNTVADTIFTFEWTTEGPFPSTNAIVEIRNDVEPSGVPIEVVIPADGNTGRLELKLNGYSHDLLPLTTEIGFTFLDLGEPYTTTVDRIYGSNSRRLIVAPEILEVVCF